MTTVDSQIVVSLDTPDFGISAKKDDDDAHVGTFDDTPQELDTPLSDSTDPLTYFRKGDGRRPVSGGLKASQATKQTTPSSSSKNNNNTPTKRPVTTNPPKSSSSPSKNKTKK